MVIDNSLNNFVRQPYVLVLFAQMGGSEILDKTKEDKTTGGTWKI